jgi:hypothetical protein
MYERSYGYRYAELGDHASNADIAKAIRADVKQAKAEGLLPARWSYSVRSDDLSVDVEVRDCLDAWQPCDGGPGCHDVWCAARNDPKYAHAATAHVVLTEEAEAARMTLQRIHGAYNHDGSEIQVDYFDVRYYGHVEFETASGREFRLRERDRLEQRKAERKAEREAGTVAGQVTNYKRDGSRVTHLVIEIPIEGGAKPTRKALACGARSWRGPMIAKASDDALVTCSRCAKRAASLQDAAQRREP